MKEPRTTAKGTVVQSFGLSVMTNPTAEDSKDRYEIFNFLAFGDVAKKLGEEFHAGKVYAHIQGAPKNNKFVDGDGVEKRSVSFWANKVSCYPNPVKIGDQAKACRNAEHRGTGRNTTRDISRDITRDIARDDDMAF